MSINKPVIISGEASETDSDEDTNSKVASDLTKSFHGVIVSGEDSESENEINTSISSAVSALKQVQLQENKEATYATDSLFHQKLRECNDRLCNDIENLCQSTMNEARKNLNSVDQQLLRAQFTMQNAVTSLKTLSINSLTIKNKLHCLLSSNFLSNVSVAK